MELFSLPEVASRILLFTDCDSLLELRLVNKQLHTFVDECTPLFYERDELPIVKSFFHWALMHSKTHATRYTQLFCTPYTKGICCSSCRITGGSEELLSLLGACDFDAALALLKPELLDAEVFAAFLSMFGESDQHIEWLQDALHSLPQRNATHGISYEQIRNGVENHYDEACLAALRCDNPVRILGRIWSQTMVEKVTKEKMLNFITTEKKGTLDLFYTVEQLYPHLSSLEQNLSPPPRSWFAEMNAESAASVLPLVLRANDTDTCDYLLSLGAKCYPTFLTYCTSLKSIDWLCSHLKINTHREGRYYYDEDWTNLSTDNLIKRLVEIKCSGEELESFLTRHSITSVGSTHLAYAETFFQFEVLSRRVDLKRPGDLSVGHLLLLQNYDREKFNLVRLVESGSASIETLRFVLTCKASEIDWDKLVEAYLYNHCNSTEIISVILEKDAAHNDFSGGVPSRWKYDRTKEKKEETYHIVL